MNKLYFRAWNKYTERMIYLNEIGGSVDLDADGTYSVNWYDDLGKLHTLDDAILMQGLEINGVVIYEGDIIAIEGCPNTTIEDICHLYQIKKLLEEIEKEEKEEEENNVCKR